jgi:predicted nucleotide-binding protein
MNFDEKEKKSAANQVFNIGTAHGAVGNISNSQVTVTSGVGTLSYQTHPPALDNINPELLIPKGVRIFIGHGRSPLWRELKDFLQDSLKVDWDEFNRESAAGVATTERLSAMLETAAFAFLIMTAEDMHGDGKAHARENVIHEIGLFQGRLGFRKAIVLLEEGCEQFSNIHGLTQIRFPKNDILARAEEIRRVLIREGLLKG